MIQRRELFEGYSQELKTTFKPFINEANEFVKRNQGKIATLYTPQQKMQGYVQDVIELGKALVSGIRSIGAGNYLSIYESALNPSREAFKREDEPIISGFSDYVGIEGPGFVRHRKIRYHILEKVNFPNNGIFPRTLLVMLQRVPSKVDTGHEIHGVKIKNDMLIANEDIGGIEMYIPLQKDTSFWINGKRYSLEPLDGVIVLPGDVHSLGGERWPSKNIIIMAFGAGLGEKVDEGLISRGVEIDSLPTPLPLVDYSRITRCANLR